MWERKLQASNADELRKCWDLTTDVDSLTLLTKCRRTACVSRSRTSSVTDRRLILSGQPRRTTRKILTSSVVRMLLWRRWQQKWLDLSKCQVRRQTIIFTVKQIQLLPCYKSNRLSVVCDHQTMWFYTTIMRRFKIRPYFLQTCLNCRPWRHQLVMILWLNSQQNRLLQCKQSHEANASKRVRPFIGASNLRPYI